MAFHRHPGFFFSAELESLLIEVAQMLPMASKQPCHVPSTHSGVSKPRILHVMTNAFGTGGHTRLVERLVVNTSEQYEHLLVTTAQRGPLPDRLRGIFCSGCSKWTDLAASGADLIGRSLRLRQISREAADIVFLHAHPYDVVPLLAFGIPDGPPVIVLNHADHLFWLGVSVADAVADIRLAGQNLTLTRRNTNVSEILPIPLVERESSVDRLAARKRLGIDDDAVVLLTIASHLKYSPLGEYNFLDTVTALLKRSKQAVLVACGPQHAGAWKEASDSVGGRIKAYGVQTNISDFHSVADIYLDSFPYASLTSLLETALHAVPVIGLANTAAPIFSDGSTVEGDAWTHATSLEEYVDRVGALIADPELRRVQGSKIREQVAARHLLPGWQHSFSKLMEVLPSSHSICIKAKQPQSVDANDLFLASMGKLTSGRHSINTSLRKHGGCFPVKDRFTLLVKGILGIDGIRVLPVSTYAGKEFFS